MPLIRFRPLDRLLLTRPSFVEYFLLAVRLKHGLIATLPGFLLCMMKDGWVRTETNLAVLLFFGLLTVLIFQALGVYNERLFSNLLRFRTMLFAWCAAFCVLLFMYKELNLLDMFSSKSLIIWFIVSLFGFGAGRLFVLLLFRTLRNHGHFLQRAVILGGTENGIRLAEYLHQNGDIRVGVVGFIDDRQQRLPKKISHLNLLGNIEHLYRLIRQEEVHQVLVALPWSAENRIGQILRSLKRFPVNVLLVPDMIAFRHAHNRISDIAGLPMFDISQLPLNGWSPLFKRMEDIILSFLFLIPLAPLMLLIAIAIKLDSPGPVLFRQKRYGYNNRLIEVYKFRSMHVSQSDPDCDKQTTRDDRRVTRIGRFIRKTSLDELPQLFNVLFGSMSLVGPRPHATATKAAGILFEDAVEEYTARHRVKPGITGWAQVNGYRGETDTVDKIQKRVEYDLEYIEHWSIWFDLYILFRTLPAVLFTRTAY